MNYHQHFWHSCYYTIAFRDNMLVLRMTVPKTWQEKCVSDSIYTAHAASYYTEGSQPPPDSSHSSSVPRGLLVVQVPRFS